MMSLKLTAYQTCNLANELVAAIATHGKNVRVEFEKLDPAALDGEEVDLLATVSVQSGYSGRKWEYEVTLGTDENGAGPDSIVAPTSTP